MNKLIRKLTLSGVTLGVAALSLTTSTYAWFTTNTTATASGISGSVKASGGNMLIKTLNYWQGDVTTEPTTTTADTWSDFASTVTLHAKDGVKMNPVTYTQVDTSAGSGSSTPNTSGFYKGTDGGTTFTTAAEETDYLHYKIIFALSSLATGTDITNKVTMKVDKFTSDVEGSQYLLVNASTDGAKAGDTIKVNLLDVLSMRVESTIITSDNSNSSYTQYGIQSSDLTSPTLTASNACYRYRAESETVKVKDTSGDSWSDKAADALTYYNTVHGISALRPTEDKTRGYITEEGKINTLVSNSSGTESANTIELFSVSGVEKAYVMCDIYFYIDGWDKQCFNAAGGLSLSEGSLNFELNPNK